MLHFLLTLVIIGALIGLLFSRNGKEGEDAMRGAKKGLSCGCMLIILGTIVTGGLLLVFMLFL